MNTIVVNGKRYETNGKSISVVNGAVKVDGKTIVDELSGVVEIKWDGPLADLRAEGSVTCGVVAGNVSAGGSVEAGDVGGSVRAGGSVRCEIVSGGIQAGGSVRRH